VEGSWNWEVKRAGGEMFDGGISEGLSVDKKEKQATKGMKLASFPWGSFPPEGQSRQGL